MATEPDPAEHPDEALPEVVENASGPLSDEALRDTRLTPADAVAGMHIRVPARGNRKLRHLLERVEADKQLKAWWHVANVNAVVRLEINDHSWVHVQIVTNIAVKLLRQLVKHGVTPSLVSDYRMTTDDSEVVVVLAALMHDVGMSVHRRDHEDFSLFLAEPKARELLEGIYDEPERTVMVSEALQAIISHRADGEPLALEAGVLRVAHAHLLRKRVALEPVEQPEAHRAHDRQDALDGAVGLEGAMAEIAVIADCDSDRGHGIHRQKQAAFEPAEASAPEEHDGRDEAGEGDDHANQAGDARREGCFFERLRRLCRGCDIGHEARFCTA